MPAPCIVPHRTVLPLRGGPFFAQVLRTPYKEGARHICLLVDSAVPPQVAATDGSVNP